MPGPIVDPLNFTFKPNSLYAQTVVTDFQVGEIVINTPIDTFGMQDPLRPTIYFGRAKLQINTQNVPIQFQIPSSDLQEAITKFPTCIVEVVEKLYEQQLRHTLMQPVQNTKLDLSKLKS